MLAQMPVHGSVRQSSHVILICLLSLGILAGLVGPGISAEITGTISLPAGDVAPINGFTVTISVFDAVGTTDMSTTNVEITVGTSFTTYSLAVANDTAAKWQVNYYSHTNGAYLNYGYYAADGTKERSDDADLLSGGSAGHSSIDMEFLKGRIIAGTVFLPVGQSAPAGGINLEVYASILDGFYRLRTSILIPSGDTSVDYSIAVENIPYTWKVNYYTDHTAYVERGYYSASGDTTWDETQAAELTAGQGTDQINMTLVAGKKFPWAMFLPALTGVSAH